MAQLDRRWQATTMEKRGGGRGSNPFGADRVGIQRPIAWPVNERSAMMLSAWCLQGTQESWRPPGSWIC